MNSAIRHSVSFSRFDNDFADSLDFLGANFCCDQFIFTLMIFSAFGMESSNHLADLYVCSNLVLMIVQAFNSEANANWAMTAFPALTLPVPAGLETLKGNTFG